MYKKKYRIDKLYHRFLRPKGIGLDKLTALYFALSEAHFIELHESESGLKFTETNKLLDRKNAKELFKIIQKLV